MPAVWLAHLEEEATDDEEGTESEDPDGLDGMHSRKRIVPTTAAAQIISSEIVCWQNQPEKNPILNHKEGMTPKEGSPDPSRKGNSTKVPQDRIAKGVGQLHTDSLLESQSPSSDVQGQKT